MPPPGGPVGPPGADRRIGLGMLLGLGVLALVAVGILIAYLLTHRHHSNSTTTVVVTSSPATTASTATAKVAVPHVVGLHEQGALTRLAQLGLRPKEVYKATSKPTGLVVSQKPKEAATVAKGSQVTVVIDRGAPKVAIPSLKGTSFEAAQSKLDALGLDSTKTEVTSSEAPGTVVDQAPAAGASVAKGSTVTLSVAKAAPVAVPNVTGQTESAATSALQSAGLTAHTVTVAGVQPTGQVTAQNPAAGTKEAKGTAVRINVSDGSKASGGASTTTGGATTTAPAATTTAPAAKTTTAPSAKTTTAAAALPPPTNASVPDVTNSQLQSAVNQLSSAGFLVSIQYIPGTDPLGTIEQQAPSGGSSAKTRSHVTINASSGPGDKTQETVPDATGKTLQEAVSTMQGAHLRLIFVKVQVTDRTQAGKVVEQTPLAGKQAPENAQILVDIGAYKG